VIRDLQSKLTLLKEQIENPESSINKEIDFANLQSELHMVNDSLIDTKPEIEQLNQKLRQFQENHESQDQSFREELESIREQNGINEKENENETVISSLTSKSKPK